MTKLLLLMLLSASPSPDRKANVECYVGERSVFHTFVDANLVEVATNGWLRVKSRVGTVVFATNTLCAVTYSRWDRALGKYTHD